MKYGDVSSPWQGQLTVKSSVEQLLPAGFGSVLSDALVYCLCSVPNSNQAVCVTNGDPSALEESSVCLM